MFDFETAACHKLCQTLIQRLHQASSPLYNRHRMRVRTDGSEGENPSAMQELRRRSSPVDDGEAAMMQSLPTQLGPLCCLNSLPVTIHSHQQRERERETSSIRLLSNFVTSRIVTKKLKKASHDMFVSFFRLNKGIKILRLGLILSPHEGNSNFCSLLSYLWS